MTELINNIGKIFSALGFRSISRTIFSLLAVVLLVTTTACNGAQTNATVNPTQTTNPRPGKITELYKPIAPPVGGMNNYSDVDPRQNTSEADAKAKRLIEKTENLSKGNTNPFKQLGKQLDDRSIPERVGETTEKINRSAQETADDVAKGTRKGYQNVKENTKSFKDDVESAVDDLGDKARAKTNDLKNDIRKAT
ncbi:hypothetical protein [Chamaesiphon sp. VAR_48_metabat_403]|uniref:hypothetical protein n=1 Tax=Chamaesiphon sp. VAR_48_metabat_403 TaxID=2964700 RepID=UPI00286EAB63|nr:hypothetical protein [Chamaesiphon sp. VAR_48_metabat_403]